MSASEFTEWKAMFTAEELHPAADRLRHAQLISAVHNGPLTRKGGSKLFAAADFFNATPWQFSVTPAPVPSISLKAQVDAINAQLDT